MLAVNAEGCVIVAVTVAVLPFESLTVKVYVPADKPLIMLPLTVPAEELNVYGLTPPTALTTTLPLLPPLMLTFVWDVTLAVNAAGCVIVAVTVVVQPLVSVTVNVYVPAAKPVCAGETLYPGVPPVETTTTLPLLNPKPVALVCEAILALKAVGLAIVTDDEVATHPFASLAVILYVPDPTVKLALAWYATPSRL